MPRLILAALVALLVSTAAFAQAAPINIDTAGLDAMMGRGLPVVDIRTPAEWEQTGTIRGAHKIMAFDDKGKLSPDFIEKLAKLGGPDTPVALICRSGSRSAVMAKALTGQLGYREVYNVEAGMNRWIKEARPLER